MKKIISLFLVAVIVSSVICFTVTTPASAAVSYPRITSFENTNSGIRVRWSKYTGASKYRLFRRVGKSGWRKVADTVDLNALDTSANESGSTYIYTVRALDASKNYISGYKDTGWSTVFVEPPRITSLYAHFDGIHIRWSAVKGASKYRLIVNSVEYGPRDIVDTYAKEYVDKNVTSGVNYSYQVIALDNYNNVVSGYSPSVKSVKYLEQPVITKVNSKTNGAEICWNRVPGAEKYRAFVYNGNGWKSLGDTVIPSIMHYSAESGVMYEYKVRCISTDGRTYETPLPLRGYSHRYFGTPTIQSADFTVNSVTATLKINREPIITRYRVFVYNYKKGGWTKIGDTTLKTMNVNLNLYTNYIYTENGKRTLRFTIRGMTDNGNQYLTDYDNNGFKFTLQSNPRCWKPQRGYSYYDKVQSATLSR